MLSSDRGGHQKQKLMAVNFLIGRATCSSTARAADATRLSDDNTSVSIAALRHTTYGLFRRCVICYTRIAAAHSRCCCCLVLPSKPPSVPSRRTPQGTMRCPSKPPLVTPPHRTTSRSIHMVIQTLRSILQPITAYTSSTGVLLSLLLRQLMLTPCHRNRRSCHCVDSHWLHMK